MERKVRHTAVGAGTTAGDALEEEATYFSRAAEAEDDEILESLRTTGARISGVPGAQVRPLDQPENDGLVSPPPESGGPDRDESIHAETPRSDLVHNEAGIASRLVQNRELHRK